MTARAGGAGAGTLLVVATPIGNLEDLSLRAIRILRTAAVVAAEDTRTARSLLRHVDGLAFGDAAAGARRVVSLFEGNEAGRVAELLGELAAGQAVALISEAGTPGISDPGQRVIAAAVAAGVKVEVVPGPAACIAALVASGLPTERFLFLGFPPREAGARKQLFGGLRAEPGTLVLYEAPDRVATTLADLAAALGPARRASVSRELTKVFEEHLRGELAELAARLTVAAPRGECTLVVEGAAGADAAAAVDVEAEVRRLLAEGLGPRDVAGRLVVVTGKPRRQLYQLALALAREPGGPR
ncbi:MAG: 16S rRNA (cytidine(1402)-2'-O)-methyltransferase [Kofleriaceae bacterium]